MPPIFLFLKLFFGVLSLFVSGYAGLVVVTIIINWESISVTNPFHNDPDSGWGKWTPTHEPILDIFSLMVILASVFVVCLILGICLIRSGSRCSVSDKH